MSITPTVSAMECRCGRAIRPVHCPSCGSTNLYACTKAALVDDRQNPPLLHKGFRCRKCGELFHEGQPCAASQPTKRTRADNSAIVEATDTAKREARDMAIKEHGGDRMAYIASLLKKRGAIGDE